jgi:hypothetical protein
VDRLDVLGLVTVYVSVFPCAFKQEIVVWCGF